MARRVREGERMSEFQIWFWVTIIGMAWLGYFIYKEFT
jgi:hypothetical protein